MPSNSAQEKLLAHVLFEIRSLLASHIGASATGETHVRATAELAYALHNCALQAMAGDSFDTLQAIAAVERVESKFGGGGLAQRLREIAAQPSA